MLIETIINIERNIENMVPLKYLGNLTTIPIDFPILILVLLLFVCVCEHTDTYTYTHIS